MSSFTAPMPEAKLEQCANCERIIGKLETPRVHGEHVVCGECWERLHVPAAAPAVAMNPRARLEYAKPEEVRASFAQQTAAPDERKGDPLTVPRYVVLFLAIAMSFMSDRTLAYMLWGAWLLMGIIGLAMKHRD